MAQIATKTAATLEVMPDAFTVEVETIFGKKLYHRGPEGYLWFTKDEAERLVERIQEKGFINLEYWSKGQVRPYAG